MTVNEKIKEVTNSLIQNATAEIDKATEGFIVVKNNDEWTLSMWFEIGGEITVIYGSSHLSVLKESLKFLRKKLKENT